MLDEARQTKDQLTITVKVNYFAGSGGVSLLPAGWVGCRCCFGNDERQLCGHHYAVYYVLSMEQGTKC